MSNSNKTYLVVNEDENGKILFRTPDGRVRWYRAGGNATQPKYIIQTLVNLYGATEGAEVYEKFMKALLAVRTIKPWYEYTWAIVVYETHE